MGSLRLPPRIATGLVLLLVVAAATTGYLVGSGNRAATPAPGASPSSTASAVAEPITWTSKRCSVQVEDRLQLGIEIVNQSATTVTLRQVLPVLPLRGLSATAATWGGCGQLSPPATGDGHLLPAGATTWLTVTFDVLVPCPAPLPVFFTVRYTQENRSSSADLPGFPDLGDVPYTKCPTDSS
ncbi:hypothetical protein [Sphaerisporangium rubeum]|uniref:Uncharacterized protein n=1 Tax=Sphaerisporangium rubeum TaxID=321317 RepID=A0A7X0M4U7_9ACTN|nr:hypothetical protein [Sphaerisporangium rubeum]MBB6471650.1 hypothetical protein [Sphaerisporangium rubeum]